jgi:hypothetical protein
MPRHRCWILLLAALAGCRARLEPYRWGLSPEADAQRVARFTDSDLQHKTERLFIEPDLNNDNYLSLRASEARAVPFLIRALDDPRTWTAVFATPGYKLTANSPFQRICDLLGSADGIGAAKPVARYLKHPDPRFRQHAARLLGILGTADCLEPLKVALADPERHVREAALSGVKRGLDKRHDPLFLDGVFAVVLPLLTDGKYEITGPAEVLAEIDIGRAAPILEGPAYFNAANPQLHGVLESLNRDDVKVPLAILLPLMKDIESHEWEYAQALLLYARNPDSAAEARIRWLLHSPSDSIADGAAGALEILAGIDPWEVVKDAWEERKFAALTQAQRYYYAVSEYHGEVCNGGHHQYFYNSAADHYVEAIAGLRAMALPGKAALLERALTAFAGGKPPVQWQARRDLVEGFQPPAEAVLERADNLYFESEKKPDERVEVALALWAVAHRDEFVKGR